MIFHGGHFTDDEKRAHVAVLGEEIGMKLNLLAITEPAEAFAIAMGYWETLTLRLKESGKKVVAATPNLKTPDGV